jgi:hypothetical protein
LIGALRDDLETAIRTALNGVPAACVAEAQHYRWEQCTDAFEDGLEVISTVEPGRAA